MKAYKLISKYEHLDAGRILYKIGTEVLLIATPTKKQEFIYSNIINSLNAQGLLQEVDLLQETKIHPHLYKPIKKEVETMLTKL